MNFIIKIFEYCYIIWIMFFKLYYISYFVIDLWVGIVVFKSMYVCLKIVWNLLDLIDFVLIVVV